MDKGSINPYPNSRGTALKGTIYDIKVTMFNRMKESNPRAKLLCILENTNMTVIKDILKFGFDHHKFIDLATLSWMDYYDKELQYINTMVTMCTYNPFYNGGVFYCKNITDRNANDAVEELNEYMKQKIHNLNGFPLKVGMGDFNFFRDFILRTFRFTSSNTP